MIKRIFWFLIIAGILCYLYATKLGIKGLDVHEYVIDSETIPNNYNGFTIAHFSDLLYGSTTNIDDVYKLVDKINAYNPDIVVFTGNLIDNEKDLEKDEKDKLIAALKNINPKQKKFAIYSSMDEIKINRFKEIMDAAEFKILDNKNDLVFRNDNAPLLIAGVTDISKIEETLKNDTESFFKIALIHKSDDADKIVNNGLDAIFAGGSLGGLVKVPFIGGIFKQDGASKYLDGRYKLSNETELFVSSGLGTYNQHFRALNKPSFNIYKLYNKTNAD